MDDTIAVGVEVYAMTKIQGKINGIKVDARELRAMKTKRMFLSSETAEVVHLEDLKQYFMYGGERIYFSRDDISEIKLYAPPGTIFTV